LLLRPGCAIDEMRIAGSILTAPAASAATTATALAAGILGPAMLRLLLLCPASLHRLWRGWRVILTSGR
jgi:hypothetical protein